mmetsp:Transcript_11005/g.17024  ORF Transcript_11005/g.17024 Transcript_11005/m.17024 type:complete len:341 (-) Transcript_11005:97-1119(-)
MMFAHWHSNLTRECRPKQDLPILIALLYSFFVAVSFVISLYVLVPKPIRELARDDPRQIKSRMIAVWAVCLVSILVYPLLFCDEATIQPTDNHGEFDSSNDNFVSALHLMGWSSQNLMGPLLHSMLLYVGPIFVAFCRIHVFRQRNKSSTFFSILSTVLFRPNLPSTVDERWSDLRNLVVAPLTEEVAFRGCIVPALLIVGMKSAKAVFVSPLFFGTAHFHHAILKLKEGGSSIKFVVLVTLFQFTYTSLFGSYAAYAFIRTNSILSVSLSHAFCNFMGLPDIHFLIKPNPESPMYIFRWSIRIVHIVGIILFIKGFSWEFLLPNKPVLMKHIVTMSSSP